MQRYRRGKRCFTALFVLLVSSSVTIVGERANARDRASSSIVEAATATTGSAERVVDLPLGTGGKQRVLYLAPPSPRAIIVMFPGGAGDVGLGADGVVRHDDNFVIRTRSLWVARGYAVVIPDTIDRANLRGIRSSTKYASVVGKLVRFARAQSAGPVFLLGTSQGSIAAASGSSHAEPGTLAGLILTESVSRLGASHETVFDAGLEDIRIPTLIVANRDDRCEVATPQDAPKIAAAMTRSPDVSIVEVEGGANVSGRDCGSRKPHGYYGIEAQVVETIDDWIVKQVY